MTDSVLHPDPTAGVFSNSSDGVPGVEQVMAASRALVGVVARSLADVLDDVTLPQFRALVLAHRADGLRARDLAAEMGIHQSGATRLVDRLVTAGLVSRTVGVDDRREVLVRPTPAGARLVTSVMDLRLAHLGAILSGLSADDVDRVVTGFRVFAAAAGEHAAAADALGW